MKTFIQTNLLLTLLLTALYVGAQETPEQLIAKAKQLRLDKKYSEAKPIIKQVIDANPNYTEARYEMAWIQNEEKDYTGALVNLRKVRSDWSDVARVYFEMGYAFEKLVMKDSARTMYAKTLELNPDYSNAHKQLGTMAYIDDNTAEALRHFEQYEKTAKNAITDYLYWYRKGYSFNAEKRYADALVALNKSIIYKNDYTSAYHEIGFAQTKLKEADAAIAAFKKSIELDPKGHIGYNGVGEVYRDIIKDRETAMMWYEKTLAIKPTERKACFGKGYCLNSLGKYSEAIPYLETAIRSETDYTAAFVELGYSQYMLSQNEAAIKNLREGIRLNPKNENARYYLVLVYVSQKDKVSATRVLDELKQLSSKHVETLQPKIDNL